MEKMVFGYYIAPDIHVDINKKIIVNVNKNLRIHQDRILTLRETMFRLFIFMLENADGSIIDDYAIMTNVWDRHGLSSSSQRLWQVMQILKMKLAMNGVPDDLIMRVESKGYYVRESLVTALYSDKRPMPEVRSTYDIYNFGR